MLVVEDEAALREVTRRLLCRNGYQVLVPPPTGRPRWTWRPATRALDVLLTDVVMPKMQGREVAERIRALQPAARVLYMSGYTQGLLGEQGVLEPGVQLIEKPFTESGLLGKLNEVLSCHRPP